MAVGLLKTCSSISSWFTHLLQSCASASQFFVVLQRLLHLICSASDTQSSLVLQRLLHFIDLFSIDTQSSLVLQRLLTSYFFRAFIAFFMAFAGAGAGAGLLHRFHGGHGCEERVSVPRHQSGTNAQNCASRHCTIH